MIEFRTMQESDITAGLSLCRTAGWNQLENDWKIFLENNPSGSRVAIDESNNVIGTVATINYNNHFSWIGMVLVHPEKKRQGIGTQLLLQALQILEEQETIKLDATPAGREVYLKLGFEDEYVLSRMELATKFLNNAAAEEISAETMPGIQIKDDEVFGAPRINVLNKLFETAPQFAWCIKTKNSFAYCFGRNGYKYTQIGPVVADTSDDAIQLVSAVLKNVSGPVILDVHDGSPFQQWLTSIGFKEQRKLIRMFKGTNSHPGIPEKQFAILGPEFG
jgi:GNAT superfamily N-acetyltransferase